jgi:Fe(3+) dicitrate transport protein
MHGFAGLHLGFAPPRAVSSIRADGATVDLDEEKSLSYEAGVRLKRRRRWRLHLAGFLGHYFNQIVPASLGDRTTLTNGGATRQLGIESDAKLSFGHLIGRGTLLDLGARYTLMRAQFVGGDSDGRQLPYAPNHLLHLLLDLGHAIGAGAQLAYSYVGAQYTDDMETLVEDVTGRTGRLDAYHRLDANLRYRHPRSGLTATLAVKDLLDRPFITSRRPEGIFAAGFRQITFGLRWDYGEAP